MERAKFRSLQEALAVLGAAVDGGSTKPTGARLFNGQTLKDLVVAVLAESATGLRGPDIKEKLDVAGRVTDLNSVQSTLSRLKFDGLAYKGDDGRWYTGSGPEAPEPNQPSGFSFGSHEEAI